MYDALGNSEGINNLSRKEAEFSEEAFDRKVSNENVYETPPKGSAVLPPSSVVHRSSPQVQIRQIALSPTSIETDKDTQQLVEEDKSEC